MHVTAHLGLNILSSFCRCSGDPTMYEEFWRKTGDSASILIPGWQTMSYFSDLGGICWFVEPGFESAVRRLHRLVGNAVVDGYHVLVGTGSTQLFQAALYALSPASDGTPMNVISPAPYYSVRRTYRDKSFKKGHIYTSMCMTHITY